MESENHNAGELFFCSWSSLLVQGKKEKKMQAENVVFLGLECQEAKSPVHFLVFLKEVSRNRTVFFCCEQWAVEKCALEHIMVFPVGEEDG